MQTLVHHASKLTYAGNESAQRMKTYTFDVSTLRPGESVCVLAGGRALLLSRGAGGVFASEATCPHQLLSLEGARVRGDALMCPHHGARFRLGAGASLTPQLTDRQLKFFEATLVGNVLSIALPEGGAAP